MSTISNTNPIPIERKNDGNNYGQFSSFQESEKGETDTYRLHGQNEDGKNTQIIINLTNEPKSFLGYEKGKESQPKEDLFSTDYPVYDDFIGPPAPPSTTLQPPPAPTVGPPAPPISTVGPPGPPAPPITQLPQYGYRTTAAPIYYGQFNPQAEPPLAPQGPPTQNYAAPVPQAPPPQNYQVAQAPPPQDPAPQNYGAPQAPPQQNYGVPQAPPQQSYGVPQAPPQQSYGVPQAPPVSYDPPAPPADPIVQLQTQYVMPALTLSWEQPVIQQELPQDPLPEPPPKPSYNAPNAFNDDNGLVQTRVDPETGNSYHIHVEDINDIRQLDEVI